MTTREKIFLILIMVSLFEVSKPDASELLQTISTLIFYASSVGFLMSGKRDNHETDN